jgi:hypothetical protein
MRSHLDVACPTILSGIAAVHCQTLRQAKDYAAALVGWCKLSATNSQVSMQLPPALCRCDCVLLHCDGTATDPLLRGSTGD